MKLNQGLMGTFIALLIFLSYGPAIALESPLEPPLVALELPQDNLASYKERRTRHGFVFNINYEPIEFKEYVSFIDNYTFKDMFGDSTLNFMALNLDYKFNFSLGALSLGALYGMGKIEGPDARSLDLQKYGARLKYTMDNLFKEPYVAPYAAIDFWQMSYRENSQGTEFSGTTQMSYNYTFGLLLQLNWIDWETATNATFDYGLENTFIDLYITQYSSPQAADDPDLSSEFTAGAGLVLEF